MEKQGKPGSGAISLILEENVLQWPCILACLEDCRSHLLHGWETRAGGTALL